MQRLHVFTISRLADNFAILHHGFTAQDRADRHAFYFSAMRGRVAAIGLVISVISVILIAIAQHYSRWDTK